MSKKHQICRSAQLDSLAPMRDLIKQAVAEHRWIDDEFLYDLQLAVDEASTNIITHGYQGREAGTMILELDIDEQRVLIRLTDFGRAFEPASAPAPDLEAALEDRPMGGFGLFFIYQTMDDVDYTSNGFANQLTLVKRRKQV